MSDFVQTHLPCPACSSSDAYAINADGWGTCFSCNRRFPPDDETRVDLVGGYNGVVDSPFRHRTRHMKSLVPFGEYGDLNKRKIRQETCEKYGYFLATLDDGRRAQVAPYHDANGRVVAQKVRPPDKKFFVTGNMGEATLFGQHLWKAGGKRIVVTEGEIDALSVAQALGLTWPVVSVPNGAAGAKKALSKNLEFLNSYDKVVLMFDRDEAGQKATEECIALFDPGKCLVAVPPGDAKDANEALQAGMVKELVNAVWEAQVRRPDGIISGEEITFEDLREGVTHGYTTPYPALDAKLHGIRKGELTLLTAGSGIGKSTLARELAYHFHQVHGLKIGNVYLEESYRKTAQGYVAIHNDVPLGELRADPGRLTEAQWRDSVEAVIRSGRMFFYNHFGSLESDNLLAKLKYLATSEGVDFIVLDHISIVVSGQEGSGEGERKDIDRLMTALRSLIEQTGVGVIAIVHLKQLSDGKAHEEGARVTLAHLRGSGSLKQLSDNVIALERNQQGKDPNKSLSRVLKNREFGDLGPADILRYDRSTGRLLADGDAAHAFIEDVTADEDEDLPF